MRTSRVLAGRVPAWKKPAKPTVPCSNFVNELRTYAMSDGEDPFAKRKRKNTSAKRKKRLEKLSFAEESESDGDNEPAFRRATPSFNRKVSNVSKKEPMRKPFGVPLKHASVEKEKMDVDSDDERRDYSTKGLNLLREETATAPKESSVAEPENVLNETIDVPNAGAETGTTARDSAFAEIRNADYISLEREATEKKLGDAFDMDAIAACDPMVIDGTAGNSDEDEWEREQLKRVGIPLPSMSHGGSAETKKPREIIEEEDMSLGMRGEVGASAVDTCLECIADDVEQSGNHLSLLNSKAASIQASVGKSSSVLSNHDTSISKSKEREKFYQNLSQFAGDVTEMLAELQPKVSAFYTTRLEALEAAAGAVETPLTQTHDEFGRTLDISHVFRQQFGNGETDQSNHKMKDVEANDVTESVFADVEEEFISIERISEKFRDWRRKYPADYKKAYGDMSIGKISGAIAMGMPQCEEMEWLHALPRNSRPFAIEASHVCELVKYYVVADWKPSSLPSTKAMYKIVRDIVENIHVDGTSSKFASTAVSLLWNSFLKRLTCEAHFLRQVCPDSGTPVSELRAICIAVISNSFLMYDKCFGGLPEGLKEREQNFFQLLFVELTQCTSLLSNRLESTVERVGLWTEVVSSFASTKSEVISADNPMLNPVRNAIRSILKLTSANEVPAHSQACFGKIGV